MKKVCVFTGTRAEYGQLALLMRELDRDPAIRLQLLVTGTHLSPEFGLTYKAIEADGFHIDEKVEALSEQDTPTAICESMGKGLTGYAQALTRLHPDLLVILGDRYEALAAATAAAVCAIPIVHLHGGETTLGATDELYRHAITKLSALHLTAAEPYRNRVIQMGEHPDRVFNVGALAVENTVRIQLTAQAELEKNLNFHMGNSCLLVTYHPATMDQTPPQKQMQNLFDALDATDNVRILFTKANADSGGRAINQMIDDYVANRPDTCAVFSSLGQQRYLSAMAYAGAVVGNSSSGITEAPSMKTPTVNIGSRQQGRIRATSVIDCAPEKADIQSAIQKALSKEFRKLTQNGNNPYFQKNTAETMLCLIKEFNPGPGSCKDFYDLPGPRC